eukprot:SAG22_NODE_380_length_11402_cov_8.514154_7_plen_289_part_00
MNLICDEQAFAEHVAEHGTARRQQQDQDGNTTFLSEVPAPKVGLRRGDMVLLAECFDWRSRELVGEVRRRALRPLTRPTDEVSLRSICALAHTVPHRTALLAADPASSCWRRIWRQVRLYNVTRDPGQSHDLSASLPATVAALKARAEDYGNQAVSVALSPNPLIAGRPPQVTKPPWAALWDPAKQTQVRRREPRAGWLSSCVPAHAPHAPPADRCAYQILADCACLCLAVLCLDRSGLEQPGTAPTHSTYFCANCSAGKPTACQNPLNGSASLVWAPWCSTDTSEPC